jgi:Na+/pantothenate symporter
MRLRRPEISVIASTVDVAVHIAIGGFEGFASSCIIDDGVARFVRVVVDLALVVNEGGGIAALT